MFRKNGFRNTAIFIFAVAMAVGLMTIGSIPAGAAGGGLDNTFDGNGRLATDFNNNFDTVTDIAIQSNGKVVAVGISAATDGASGDVAIARYNVDGSLDTTFSMDGKMVLVAGNCRNASVALTSFGDMYIAYSAVNGTDPGVLYVTRLNSDGTFDTSFDEDGTASDQTLPNFVLGEVILQSDGKPIVVGGSSGTVSGGSTPASDWLLWRFSTSGVLDTGFSTDGRVQTDFGGNSGEYAASVAVLSNGAIIASGTASPAAQGFALAKYTTNGSLDTNWGGGDGKVFTDISPFIDVPADMEIESNGRIVVGGTSRTANFDSIGTIVRYNADGLLDTTFDGDGIVQSAGFGISVEGVEIQENGRILGVGGSSDFLIGRLNLDGTPDTTFGNGGFVATDMNNGSDDEARAIALMFDRRIVVAGSTFNSAAGSTENFGVARYLPTNLPYKAPFDFDGDAQSDIGIFRPGNGQWWITRSSNNSTPVYPFGSGTDRIAPADFTGDGRADVGLYRPSTGQWFVLRSENSTFYAFPFGANGDIPVPGDYDADGKADAAVYRPSNSVWYISQSSGAPTQIVQFGITGDQPVVADYDEDGRADIAIFRPGPGEWWIQRSTAGTLALQFGATGDKPVPGDYTGDGRADIAIFRPSNGQWFIVRSEDSSFYGFPFGTNGDIPAPADYDGDGLIDPAIVRGIRWYVSRRGTTDIFNYGATGDIPVASAFVP